MIQAALVIVTSVSMAVYSSWLYTLHDQDW